MSYNTNLKTWGATGSEYPDSYSYTEGEQPVDEWDNFVTSNIIEDVQHLVAKTNNDLLHRTGGLLTGNLDVDTNSLLGSAGTVDFSGTSLDIDATTNVLQSLDVGGNITTTGTVDGVNVSSLKTDFDTLYSSVSTHQSSGNPHSNSASTNHDNTAHSQTYALASNISTIQSSSDVDHDSTTGGTSGNPHANSAAVGHGKSAHAAEVIHDGDGIDRDIYVIAAGASDPASATADDIIIEQE